MDVFKNIMDESNKRADKREVEQKTVYNYTVLDGNFNETDKRGKCYILNRRYDPCMDYNIISIQDIDDPTKSFSICQFYISLKKA